MRRPRARVFDKASASADNYFALGRSYRSVQGGLPRGMSVRVMRERECDRRGWILPPSRRAAQHLVPAVGAEILHVHAEPMPYESLRTGILRSRLPA